MNFAEPSAVFQIANTLALAGWVWLVLWLFLPKAAQRNTRFIGLILPLMLGVGYAAVMMVHFSAAQGGFDSLEGVLSLFEYPGAALGGWIHYLSFDLFVGWCITRHAKINSVSRLLVILCLFFTFMLGPVGLLMYGVIVGCRYVAQQFIGTSDSTSRLWRQVLGGQPALVQCGIFLMCLLPVLTVAMLMDTRTVLELNIWVKSLKFALSLIVYTLTLSWYSNYLPERWRTSRWFNVFVVVAVVAILLEMIWLIYAASIGEPAHFNQAHPILARIYPLMGIVAVVLTSLSLVIGAGLLMEQGNGLRVLTRKALAYGLIATFVLTVITAGYMASVPAQAHAVLPEGVSVVSERDALPVLGWLRSAGDLRVAHFFATHALHFIPLLGWLLARFGAAGDGGSARRYAITITLLYSAGVFALLFQAINGQPLF